jgi:hypothetical protein
VRFQVLTAVNMKFRVFWEVLPFSQVDVDVANSEEIDKVGDNTDFTWSLQGYVWNKKEKELAESCKYVNAKFYELTTWMLRELTD